VTGRQGRRLGSYWMTLDSFGGLVVSMLASGSNPAEAVGFFTSVKNPQHAFLRRGSKRICPMSQLCGMQKNLAIYVNYSITRKIPFIVPSFAS
jgi:hypothetical protein